MRLPALLSPAALLTRAIQQQQQQKTVGVGVQPRLPGGEFSLGTTCWRCFAALSLPVLRQHECRGPGGQSWNGGIQPAVQLPLSLESHSGAERAELPNEGTCSSLLSMLLAYKSEGAGHSERPDLTVHGGSRNPPSGQPQGG